MKRFICLLLSSWLICQSAVSQTGFATVTNLDPIATLTNTAESQQAKVWTYAGKHWTILGTAAGTVVLRLDGTTWTNVLTLASGSFARPDIRVVGNLVHLIVYKGTSSVFYSIEYDPATVKYKLWTKRKTRVDLTLEAGVSAATLDIDGTGRLWLASDGTTDINVRWSDDPYTTWSAPIKLETSASTSDLCAVVAMPATGQIGVFWSNRVTRRFAFKTHVDGTDPTIWSSDELPASQSALNIGSGFADNQFNLKSTSTGQVYAAIKTLYNSTTAPQLGLLVRQPSGSWDAMYPVTTTNQGTRPYVLLNDSLNKLKVVYTTTTGIAYKETPTASIGFGPEMTLISGAYDFTTSVKATYRSETVVLASNSTTTVGILGMDRNPDITPPSVLSINRQQPAQQNTSLASVVYRVTFSEAVTGVDVSDFLFNQLSGNVAGTVSDISQVGSTSTIFDVTVNSLSGAGDFELDLKATGTGIVDQATVPNPINGGFSSGQVYSRFLVAPTLSNVTISSSNSISSWAKPGDLITLSFTTSEPINAPVVSIEGRSATTMNTNGDSYQSTITLTSTDPEGVIDFSINFSNLAGTAGTQVTATSDASQVIFDKTLPVVNSISRHSPLTLNTSLSTVIYRIIFSESVTGVDISDFDLTAVSGTVTGTVSGVAAVGSTGTTYDITVQNISSTGDLRLDLKSVATAISDNAGNNESAGFAAGQVYHLQGPPPTLSSVGISSSNAVSSLARTGDLVTILFTASEPVALPVVQVEGNEAAVANVSGNTYQATYTLTSSDPEGPVSFNIQYRSLDDIAGIDVSATTDNSLVTFDRTRPLTNSVLRQSPSTQTTTLSAVTFRVQFSEPVTGVDRDDFMATATSGSPVGTISTVSSVGSSGTTYDVLVDPIAGFGTLRLDVAATGTGIADAAGNTISGGFQTGAVYIIEDIPPTLTYVSISSVNSTATLAKPGDLVTVNFTASEAITVPTVTISGSAATVNNTAGNQYTATYTMQSSNVEGTVSFNIAYSNLDGTPGTIVTTTTDASQVNFDKTIPAVISINRQLPLAETISSTGVTVRVIFSEKVLNVDQGDFEFTAVSGSVTGTVNSLAVIGTTGTTYEVGVTGISGTGTLRVDLKSNGTGIVDEAGNPAAGYNTGQTYTIQAGTSTPGFTSVTQLSTIPLTIETKDKPQAKVWSYAGKWWTVLSTNGGTKIFRLDNTTWNAVLTLGTSSGRADVRVVGNLVHILLYRGAKSNSYLYSVEYDAAISNYKLWTSRPGKTNQVTFIFPTGAETAVMALDGNGRMWFSCAGTTEVYAWWSDAPYTTWSAPITIATGIKDDDISAITPIPAQGRIAILWSNQNTKQFGFRTHIDGTSPTTWTNDELPASQSAVNINTGFSDDHMNMKVTSDGTIYVAAKTSYNTNGYPKLILLIRRPNGTWDNAYPVTYNPEGTQPIVLINEQTGKLKIVYATTENGGNLVYRESLLSTIAFSNPITLLQTAGNLYDYCSSSHMNYTGEIVIVATNVTTLQAVSFLASDVPVSGGIAAPSKLQSFDQAAPEITSANLVYPNPFTTQAVVTFRFPVREQYTVTLYGTGGTRLQLLKRGTANGGELVIATINGEALAPGVYYVVIETGKGRKVMKVVRK